MAQLLYERDSTNKHIKAVRRHVRLCKRMGNTDELTTKINPYLEDLKAKQNSVTDKTRKHALKQNNVICIASLQLALHKIVLAVSRHCENKKSFACVDVCQGSALQQNVGAFAGQNSLLRRIVGLNVGLPLLLHQLWDTICASLSLLFLYKKRNGQKAGNYRNLRQELF